VNHNASKTQMLRLLDKLAHDDLFRGRFERNPKNALVEAGFDAAEAANFPVERLAPGILASKEAFSAEHERVKIDIFETHACMVLPGPMMTSRPRTTTDLACAA